jgi:hypothetical protein
MSELERFQHPRFARLYERISAESERRGTAEHRVIGRWPGCAAESSSWAPVTA